MNVTMAATPMRRTLVIGGVEKFVRNSLASKLAEFGLAIEWHFGMDVGKGHLRVADSCECIVVLIDITPQPDSVVHLMKEEARRRGIPIVLSTRKKSFLHESLMKAGLKPMNPVASAAIRDQQIQPVEEEEEGPIVAETSRTQHLVPVKTNEAPEKTYEQCRRELKELLRYMGKNHGLESLMWTPDAGAELSRVVRTQESFDTKDDE